MHSKHRKHELAEKRSVDLTAMIDVVFQLLLFFMLTSNLVKPNRIELNLPESTSGVKAAENQPLVVAYRLVDGEPEVRLNDEVLASLDDLGDTLIASADPSQQIDLRIDESVSYKQVVGVFDELRDSGFTNFSLNTIAPQAPRPAAAGMTGAR